MSEPTEKIYKALAAAGIAEEPAGQIAEAVATIRAETAKRRTTNTGTTNIDEKFAKVHEDITNVRLETRKEFAKVHEEITNARLESRDRSDEIQKEMRDRFDETQKETRDKFDNVQKQITDLRDELKGDIAKARLETKDDIAKSASQTRNLNLGVATALIAAMGVLKYL